eukprot:TRINITY_DN2935_c0_g1_i2.p1 TRINITY_DN2935_c0_g1~~TRINITY_DN2935_c0_g1_i2.p1  ORF type:complete len:364 (-),score=99.85 TRINITY_DN2935_c0_g1_i2:120-1148(-)
MAATTTTDSVSFAPEHVLYIGFNQDQTCFAVGTTTGFAVYTCDPLKERFRRDFGKGIGIVEMLFRCNILALVGGGPNPYFPKQKVQIWDDFQARCLAELEYRTDVKAVHLLRERIIVVLDAKVYIYNFSDLQLIRQLDTVPNPKGLCALSSSERPIIACLGAKLGQVHTDELYGRSSHDIQAHTGPINTLSLSLDGKLLATTSEKGTLVRIWDTATGEARKEVRRGSGEAAIHSVNFSYNPDPSAIVLTSDKGTCHVFAIADAAMQNKTSTFSWAKGLISIAGSEWSFAQETVPPERSIVCFGTEKFTVIMVTISGRYFKFKVESGAFQRVVERDIFHLEPQ